MRSICPQIPTATRSCVDARRTKDFWRSTGFETVSLALSYAPKPRPFARRALPVSSRPAGRFLSRVLDGSSPSDVQKVGLIRKNGKCRKEVRLLRTWFQKLSDISSLASTEATLKDALTDAVRELGFDCYAYLNIQPVRTTAISNYRHEWQQRYFERGYKDIDPVVTTARARMEAFTWAPESPRKLSSRVRAFYAEAGDWGIRSGITIPIRTAFGHMSMLTVASHKPSLSLEHDIDQLAAVTAVALLHAKLEQHEPEPTARAPVELTARQALCLKWSAEGKSMKAIAAIEGMSFATVNFHLNNARKALDAGSLPQATALATKLKLI
ncbi:MAG: autoinducer-binding protein [Mesorhizobium sp.]|nr:MAG: autoinducer-binding protein [Mesorhizobium sp.]